MVRYPGQAAERELQREGQRGASCQNLVTCKQDKASTILLLVPGTCNSLIAKLPFAAIRNNLCEQTIMAGERELLFCYE